MKVKNRFKKHSLKFISVFFAIFVWIYVLNSEKVKFEKTVALDYLLPEDMLFAERPPQEVIFMIEGPRAFVKSVAERDDRLLIDLNRLNPRRQLSFSVDIIPTQLHLPFGMVVERVLPRKINLKLEKKASKIIPIKAQFSGQLPLGISLFKLEMEPSEVEVYGPRSLIAKLKEVNTRPIDLEGLLGLNEVPVELQLPDDRMSPELGKDFKIKFQLKAASPNLILKAVPVRFLTQDKSVSSAVKSVTVKLMVPEKIKNRSNISSSIEIWADIPSDARGEVKAPLRAIIPPGVHLLEISPKSIIVNVR
jgi:YbbR domain-containing protein